MSIKATICMVCVVIINMLFIFIHAYRSERKWLETKTKKKCKFRHLTKGRLNFLLFLDSFIEREIQDKIIKNPNCQVNNVVEN